MRRETLAFALGALLCVVGPAFAQSPFVAELEVVALHYHTNLGSLDRLYEGLTRAAADDPRHEHLIALGRVAFLWGDVRAMTREQRLAAYDRGRRASARAVEQAPDDPHAHFWYALNTARWGQVNGVLRSLFLLPAIRRSLDRVLELDPRFTAAYAVAGNVFYEVPGLFGGDLQRAEEMFRIGLAQDPHFTAMRVGLAKTLAKRERTDEARRELQAVLDEQTPSSPADWALKDSRDARELLVSLSRRS